MQYRQIEFTKSFLKQFRQLKPVQKQKFYDRLRLFQENPYAKVLRNHALKGPYVGYRSIDISGDLRALFKIERDKIVIFALIGSHSKLYG